MNATAIYDPHAHVLAGLPYLNMAVHDCRLISQVSFEMALAAALGAASLATQGLVDVESPAGNTHPVSLMILVSAPSGERKSATLSRFFRSAQAFDEEIHSRYNGLLQDYLVQHSVWKTTKDVLQADLKKALKAGQGEGLAQDRLAAHLRAEPLAPRKLRFLFEDVTVPALLDGLAEEGCSAGLISAEGAIALDSRVPDATASLNSIWSGEPVRVSRKTSPDLVVKGARLTALLMAQPDIIQRFVGKRDGAAVANGFLARFLYFSPDPMQGFRMAEDVERSWTAVDEFNNRVSELLQRTQSVAGSGAGRRLLRFTREAREHWFPAMNYVESEINPGRIYAGAGDHASKLGENIARVAAVLHAFEGFEGDISISTLKLAMRICGLASGHYIAALRNGFTSKTDIGVLWDWAITTTKKYSTFGGHRIWRKDIMQCGPKRVKDKAVLDPVIEALINEGRVIEEPAVPGSGVSYLFIGLMV